MRDEYGRPVTDFALPEGAPAPLANAHAAYRQLCDRLATARAALIKTNGAIEEGHRQDIREHAEALQGGDDNVEMKNTNELKARTIAEHARSRVEGLEAAVDAALDEVIDVFQSERDAWLAELADGRAAAECVRRIRDGIEHVREAVADASRSQAVIEWLTRIGDGRMFRTGGAPAGHSRVATWTGGTGDLLVKRPRAPFSANADSVSVNELLGIVDSAATDLGRAA